MSSEDEIPEPEVHWLSPEDMAREQAKQHEHMLLRHVEYTRSVDRLLDELTSEQCWILYRLMVNVANDGPSLANQFVGQLRIMLRRIHKICQGCGNPDHDEQAHLLSGDGQVIQVTPRPSDSSDTSDVTGTADSPTSIDTVESQDLIVDPSDAGLSDDELMNKYNVSIVLHQNDELLACKKCSAVYPTLQARINNGLECPACRAFEELNTEPGE